MVYKDIHTYRYRALTPWHQALGSGEHVMHAAVQGPLGQHFVHKAWAVASSRSKGAQVIRSLHSLADKLRDSEIADGGITFQSIEQHCGPLREYVGLYRSTRSRASDYICEDGESRALVDKIEGDLYERAVKLTSLATSVFGTALGEALGGFQAGSQNIFEDRLRVCSNICDKLHGKELFLDGERAKAFSNFMAERSTFVKTLLSALRPLAAERVQDTL